MCSTDFMCIQMCIQLNNVVFPSLKMPSAKRYAYEAQFKLQATTHAEEQGNRAAAREININ